MRRLPATVAVMALASMASCGDDATSVPAAPPQNSCVEHGCSSFQQPPPAPQCDERPGQGYCYVNTSFDYILFVTMPQESGYAPDVTFALTASDLAKTTTGQACPTGQACTVLPAAVNSRGIYTTTPQIAVDVHRYLGNSGLTTIPMHVTFRPLTPGLTADEAPPASDLGYPLLAQLASATSDLEFQPPPRGPFGAPMVGWSATLAVGLYERTLQPDPPFDDAFPPRTDIVDIEARELNEVQLEDLDDTASRHFIIDGDVGAPDLTGFTAALEDSITHARISRVATLGPGKNDVVLFTTGGRVLQDVPVELVVAPPEGRDAVPALVAPATPTIPLTQTYPQIPAAAQVSGRVVAQPGSLPVRARLIVASVPDVGELISSENVLLRYEVPLETDDEGRFSAALPPGRFDVAILPDDGSGYALALSTLVVTDRDLVQGGKSFTVVPKATMQGTVTLADGTPLTDADVEARPSAEPGNVSPNVAPTTATLPRFSRSMRTAHAHTDERGHFAMALDPGYFDVVVMPKEGTRFPWVVSTSHKMEDKDVVLDPLQIPAPIRLTRTLLAQATSSSGSFAVRGALARAFTIPTDKHIAVEIGRAVSGSDGRLELFLAPSKPR